MKNYDPVSYSSIRRLVADRLQADPQFKELCDKYDKLFFEDNDVFSRDHAEPDHPCQTEYRVRLLLSDVFGRMIAELKTESIEDRLERLEKSFEQKKENAK
jgi:hypothetical protein